MDNLPLDGGNSAKAGLIPNNIVVTYVIIIKKWGPSGLLPKDESAAH